MVSCLHFGVCIGIDYLLIGVLNRKDKMEVITYFIEHGEFVTFSSLFKCNPASFLVLGIKRYEFGCSSANSCCFNLNFLKFMFFVLSAVISYYIPIFK